MLSITHALTGAFIAVNVPDPILSVPLILASHYLEDAIPHWDVGTGLGNGTKSKRLALLHELPDLAFAGIFIILLFQVGKPLVLTPHGLAPYWGGFVALLPDLLEAPRNFLKTDFPLLRPLNRFHQALHHSIPHPLPGLAPQLIVIALITLLR